MQDGPFMPKATAVWLVQNTTLSFKQIANSVRLYGCFEVLHVTVSSLV